MAVPVLPLEVPLLLRVCRDALGGTVTVGNLLPADFLEALPFVHLRIGETRLTLQPHSRVDLPLTVDVYLDGDNADARQLARDVHLALWSAWHNQTAYPQGHISSISVTAGARLDPIPGLPAGVYQYTATYQLGIRPPSATP